MQIVFESDNNSKREIYEQGFKMSLDKVNFVSKNDAINNNVNIDNNLTVEVAEELYIEGLDDASQPKANYKMIKELDENGIERYVNASDEKVIGYYKDIVSKLGGTANAKFIDNVKIGYKGKTIKEFKVENPAVFSSSSSKVIKKGSPLSSITLIPEFGDIYKSECDDSDEELLFETRDKKTINKIAKEVEELNDFLHNEVKTEE